MSGFSISDLTDHAVLISQKRVDHFVEFGADGDDGFGGSAQLGDVLLRPLQFAGDFGLGSHHQTEVVSFNLQTDVTEL